MKAKQPGSSRKSVSGEGGIPGEKLLSCSLIEDSDTGSTEKPAPHTFKRAAPGFLHKRFLSASRKVQRHLGWENIVPSTWPELDWSSKMDIERNSDMETRLPKGKTGLL